MTPVELGAQAFWILIAAGALSGLVSWWAFRRCSDIRKLRTAVNKIVAHLFELRLFTDEPLLVLRAQRALLAANVQFLRQMIRPSLVLMLPFAILLFALDAVFARAPLPPGKAAVITLQCNTSHGNVLPQARLDPPHGIHVETPPVRVTSTSQISWRVRPIRAVAGKLQIHLNGRVIRKSISSAPGLQWLSGRPGARSVSIQYPPATVFRLNWLVWFSVASLAGAFAAALLPRRRL